VYFVYSVCINNSSSNIIVIISISSSSSIECVIVLNGVQQASTAHGCNSTLKHMINKIRRDSHAFERSVTSVLYILYRLVTVVCSHSLAVVGGRALINGSIILPLHTANLSPRIINV